MTFFKPTPTLNYTTKGLMWSDQGNPTKPNCKHHNLTISTPWHLLMCTDCTKGSPLPLTWHTNHNLHASRNHIGQIIWS